MPRKKIVVTERDLLLRYIFIAALSSALTAIFSSLFHDAETISSFSTSLGSSLSTSLSAQSFPLFFSPAAPRPNLPVFIIVKTTPDAVVRRSTMRETWIADLAADDRVQYRFFTEEPKESEQDALAVEARHEGDIVILGDLVQLAHRHIGPKMLRSFSWVTQNYNVSHAIIVDDDTYVNVATFSIDWPTWNTSLNYVGFHLMHMPVIKTKKGVVRVGKYGEAWDFPISTWPRYASGPFYALSVDLLEPFINPPLPLRTMSSNDAMTGAVLLPYDINYVHKDGFKMWGIKTGAPCVKATQLYAMHITAAKQINGSMPDRWVKTVQAVHKDVHEGNCIKKA